MLPLPAKVDLGHLPLTPQLTIMKAIEPVAPLLQNKISLAQDLIPLDQDLIPPEQDPILDPQGANLHLDQKGTNT